MEGWIKLHRKFNDTSFKNRPLVVALFIHLLLNANHEDKKFYWNKKEIIIKKGQLLTGRKELSKQTGISPQSIRTAMMILKSTSTITTQPTNKFSIISILNWDRYQDQPTSKLTNTSTINQPTTNQQLTTNKNIKNEDNIYNMSKIKKEPKRERSNFTKLFGIEIPQPSGASTEWQDYAARMAKSLGFKPTASWFKLFKKAYLVKQEGLLNMTYSKIADLKLDNPETYFYKVFNNLLKEGENSASS
jgi:hypothetical protein